MTVLFRETCRIAVEKGGFGAAWIGWVDSRAGKVVPVAWQGVEKEVLDSIPLDLAATSGAPTGVIQRVIRERRVFTCDEMKSDWSLPVGESARRLGARSLAILPLVVSGQVNGIFSVNAFESDFFSAAEELTLLTRLATNVALAVERIEQSRIIKELTVARKDAEQASHAKSAFLAAMSHEIRTPMNGVLGLVEVLAHGDLSEQQADLVGTIRESARTLLALIDDVLDFSKIEAGRLELERSPIDAGELVEAVCASLLPMAETANVDLTMFVSPRISGRLMIDEIRLRQVLYNLVGNAIKFSAGQPHQPGRVSVRLEIACDEPLRIALRVQDNGIGMRPQTVEAIFAPFSQADVSTTRRYGGTGLGLPISKRLVDLMGGEIAVESTFGQGSIFQVELPLERAPGDAPASCVELAELDCVVVGGPKSSADDLAQYLEYGGARVHRADDPARALLQVKGLPQPVVIHDLCGKQSPSKEDCAAYMDAPHVRLLFITRGRRGSARLASPKVLTLDGNALRRAALMRAVLMAAGRSLLQDRPIKAERTPLTVSRGAPSIAEARELGRLILVVEDDAINQKVILQQLGLLGFAAEVAGSGTEALRLWRQGEFALVLTDLHMPEMDGYELVRRIRREERKRRQGSGTAQPGIPILALTANALRGESQAAHQAGMDGYLTKPVPLQELRVALEQWIPGRVRPHCCGAGPDGRAAGPVLEVQVLKNLVGENRTTVRGFLEDYLVAARRLAHDLCAACAQCDPGQVAAIAHKLKSSSRSVGALALGDLCAGLETAGRAMDRTAIARGILEFESAMGSVAAAIEAELTESAP
ncbi:MAG: response regulator, partial [Burkholderiales bacterium]|nr:response regulator [Burkholderiales bacterium]